MSKFITLAEIQAALEQCASLAEKRNVLAILRTQEKDKMPLNPLISIGVSVKNDKNIVFTKLYDVIDKQGIQDIIRAVTNYMNDQQVNYTSIEYSILANENERRMPLPPSHPLNNPFKD